MEVYLRPGDWHFGGGAVRIRTLLGSCVAFVAWHPTRLLGGMTHSLLPSRPGRTRAPALDGHYVDEALQLLLGAIACQGNDLRGYRIGLYGGGNMFPEWVPPSQGHLGEQNVAVAQRLLAQHGLVCQSCHVAGTGYRHLSLDLHQGTLVLRHCSPPAQRTPE